MYDKKSDPVLTEYDITINSIHQENMFKGTITVCIIYAVFAFILICAAYFSDNIRELLFDKFLPFTLIYIIGTIIIIMIFLFFILSFKPKKIDFNKIDDTISCPDYWKLEVLDDKAIEKSFDINSFNKKLFKYRCVMDDKVFNKSSIYKQDKKNPNINQYRLANIPAFITNDDGVSTYNNLYPSDATNLTSFLSQDDNDKYLYLYKNLNSYNNSNLIYTNNKIISSNIINDLKQSALIMNNYAIPASEKIDNPTKYTDLTNAGLNIYSANGLDARYTCNYYNSPPILTWATSNAMKDASFLSYQNIALPRPSENKNFTSTVYDWSTMNEPTTGNVYAIDFEDKTSSTNNYVYLGYIQKDADKQLYFVGTPSITIPANSFNDKVNQFRYYFDTTYIVGASTLISPKNYSTIDVSSFVKGPKVRVFHKTERQPEILVNKLDNQNIPLTCSAVYPSFLTSKEDKYSENNTLRCAYSKICNIPWSDLHCNDITM